MGSPDCFEFRKEELGILGTHDEDEIVAQSFVDSVRADGEWQFIVRLFLLFIFCTYQNTCSYMNFS